MASPRSYAVGVVLDDGRVLVAGGMNFTEYATNSVELYYADAGTWRAGRPMAVERYMAAAVKLRDGRVLVAGGVNEEGRWDPYPPMTRQRATEIFDPKTDTWTSAAPMFAPRALHRGLRLSDGRVLVMGGNVEGPAAEVYDPVNDEWRPVVHASNPPLGRFFGLVELDDGRVLAAGYGRSYFIDVKTLTITDGPARDGLAAETPHMARVGGEILVFGGIGNQRAEAYRPDTDKWEPTEYRYWLSRDLALGVHLDENRYMVVGGMGAGEWGPQFVASSEIFDVRTGRFTPAGRLGRPRRVHSVVQLGLGQVMVIGGSAAQVIGNSYWSIGPVTDVEIFDPMCGALEGGSP